MCRLSKKAAFGKRINKARLANRQFVADGISHGRRNELVVSGLKRSLAKVTLEGRVEAYDARLLGSGYFVESRLLETEGEKTGILINLADLAAHVTIVFELCPELLTQRIRTKNVVRPVVYSVTLLFEKLALKSPSFLVKAVLESVRQPHELQQC